MPFWDRWISTLAERDKQTPTVVREFSETDEDDTEDVSGAEEEDLDGLFLGIYYRDSRGARSSRTITAHDLALKDGRVYLRGICHLRSAYRSFRCDRIDEVFSADGEIFAPEVFWREIGVSERLITSMNAPGERTEVLKTIPKMGPSQSTATDAPGLAQRRVCRHQIRLLAALSRSDGSMRPEEVDEIVEYICNECDFAGLPFTEEDLAALRQYIKRLRPTSEKVQDSLEALFSENSGIDDFQLRSLRRAMRAVIDADGVFHQSEYDFMAGFEAWLFQTRAAHASAPA